MKPKELLKESLKSYLNQRLSRAESELFVIAKRHGVKDVLDLDSKLKEGIINEKEAYEDYFALDNLDAGREKIKKFLEKL